jgi:hypothetical protein
MFAYGEFDIPSCLNSPKSQWAEYCRTGRHDIVPNQSNAHALERKNTKIQKFFISSSDSHLCKNYSPKTPRISAQMRKFSQLWRAIMIT